MPDRRFADREQRHIDYCLNILGIRVGKHQASSSPRGMETGVL